MNKLFAPFCTLHKKEVLLWGGSVLLITAAFFLGGAGDPMSLLASLVGATALIYMAKGQATGQFLSVVFAALYAVVSWRFRYYGEMITYLGMTAPSALVAGITWLRHPAKKGEREVKIAPMTPAKWGVLSLVTVAVTVAFYFILGVCGTANLPVSTLSVTTSFLASGLTVLRSPYYAVAYAANDLVLIVLWVLAGIADPTSLPMVACFLAFLCNDLYAFVNWRRMRKRQAGDTEG